jgi:hypothetical protein
MMNSVGPGPLQLELFAEELTIYRLDRSAKFPHELFQLPWYTISKTLDELSIIIPSDSEIFKDDKRVLKQQPGWRCFKIEGVLDFSLVGILASIVNPLKDAEIPVFVVSTFDTDYILVSKESIDKAKKAIIEHTGSIISESSMNSRK